MNSHIFLQNDSNQNAQFKLVDPDVSNTNYFVKDRFSKVNDFGVRLFINLELCNGCKLCMYECPEKVLSISKTVNKKGIYPIVYNGSECNGCGICVNICSIDDAIRIFRRVRPK